MFVSVCAGCVIALQVVTQCANAGSFARVVCDEKKKERAS